MTVTLSLAHSLPLTPSVCACVCLAVCVSLSLPAVVAVLTLFGTFTATVPSVRAFFAEVE